MKPSWSKELARLDKAISLFANRPTDFEEFDQAQSLLVEILRVLEESDEEECQAMRELVWEYPSFFWAVYPPQAEAPAETLRLRLLHFALLDQHPDPRDALLELQTLCENSRVSLEQLASLRRAVAPVASNEDRYGFGSTRSMLLRGYPSGYGKRGAPEANS